MKCANVIGVAGAGAWGMALANAAAAAGRGVVLWGRDAARMQAFAATRRSDRLPGVGLPTAVTLASTDEGLARALCDALRGPSLRLYHSTDVRGVEIGGAAKNVLAIACGVAVGRGLGASAAAALVARGFAELRRFGEAFGARGSTLMGLSGLGDLVLTCSSAQSRNFAFGYALGKGGSLREAGEGRLAEGVFTAPALTEMARARGVDMPICNCVEALVEGSLDIAGAVGALLGRPQKGED